MADERGDAKACRLHALGLAIPAQLRLDPPDRGREQVDGFQFAFLEHTTGTDWERTAHNRRVGQ